MTLPGIAIGFLLNFVLTALESLPGFLKQNLILTLERELVAIAAAAGLILLIRWVYWLIRRREGLGLGDAKLMALLAAWLGLPLALLSLSIGVVLGALLALFVLLLPRRETDEPWALLKMPLGTFLCVGGIVSALWGQPIIAAYMRWAGF
jgi:leader peptidase (prepilin peptidase)/N-methyltransferase